MNWYAEAISRLQHIGFGEWKTTLFDLAAKHPKLFVLLYDEKEKDNPKKACKEPEKKP